MKIFNARFPSIASATLLALATLGFSFHQYYFCRTLSSLKRDIDRHRQSMTASLEYGYHAGNDARYARELRNHVEILKALNSDSRLIESRKAEMVDELKKSACHAVLAACEAGYIQTTQLSNHYATIEKKTSYEEIFPVLLNYLRYAENGCCKIEQSRNDLTREYVLLDSAQEWVWIGCLTAQTLGLELGLFALRQK